MEQAEKNRMASAPVNRLMLSMGIPMIISMTLQAVYNIVDSAFVSNMAENGEQALNALTHAFPVQMLMVAVAIGTGVGMNALMSVMTYGLNLILVRISENAVTAYGLYYKIQQFILFAAFGLRDAITPIVSFNYGMGSRSRVRQGIKYGMTYTLIIMAAGLVLLEVFAEPFAALFGLSGETEQLCTGAMRVISLSFIFAGANVAFQGIFQALESGAQSLVISVCRQFLFVLPVAWGFSEVVIHSGMDRMWLVWLTFLIAEGISAVIALIFMRGISRKRIDALEG